MRYLQICVLLSMWMFTEGLLGFYKGQSLIFRAPPIPEQKSTREVELKYITQDVDNFDPLNNSTYLMRYYRNDEFFKPGSPIFVYVGGEWTIAPGSLRGGHLFDMAKELNALMFYTEHRYYGRSYPTPDASTENFRFLSVDQALADLAHFIIEMKKEPGSENSKVILIGGSYSATMVAWFRQKYPHLAVGAWASSAPLLAKLDFVEYKEIVGASIRHVGGMQCHQLLENAFAQAEELIENNDFNKFSQTFKLCDSVDGSNKLDVWSTFSLFTDILAGTVQYHSPGDIERLCGRILAFSNDNSTDLEAFGNWFIQYYVGSGCLNSNYQSDVDFYRQYEWGQGATGAGRQWFYQTCSEFGWYQTSGSEYQPFGSSFPVDLFIQTCIDVFGYNIFSNEIMEDLVHRKNTVFGGMNPAVNNVFFTHGKIDPWRAMGLQTDLNPSSPAVVIPGASHCQDLSSIRASDTEEMLAAKHRIRELIDLWLSE